MLTEMIWRMERRTVAAAMVGGNGNMEATSEAIWADVTIQSSALLPVLRRMALRAMKNTTERFWEARHGTFSLSVKAGIQEQLQPVRRKCYHAYDTNKYCTPQAALAAHNTMTSIYCNRVDKQILILLYRLGGQYFHNVMKAQ